MTFEIIASAFIGCSFAIICTFCIVKLALSQKHEEHKECMRNFRDFVKESLEAIKRNCECLKKNN